jgi:peroxiredoxin-like protein
MNPHHYDVRVKWERERLGKMTSTVLPSSFDVATPPDFPNGMPGIWSPEHLLVAAVNSCLMTTFLAIADNSKLEFISFDSNGTGKLESIDGKMSITEIILEPVVTIANEKDRIRAERIIVKSETACLISNSVKSKIILKPVVKVNPV